MQVVMVVMAVMVVTVLTVKHPRFSLMRLDSIQFDSETRSYTQNTYCTVLYCTRNYKEYMGTTPP